jgi:hypothetical protein
LADPKDKSSEEVAPLVANNAPIEDREEFIFTVSSTSGDLVRVDRLDPTTGERRPFSDEEYAVLHSYP